MSRESIGLITLRMWMGANSLTKVLPVGRRLRLIANVRVNGQELIEEKEGK